MSLYSESEYPKIIDVHNNKPLSIEKLVSICAEYDIVIMGEDHDDTNGHKFKLVLLQELFKLYPIQISMEMFEQDNQIILDEYLLGFITEKQFIQNVRLWNNYHTDYKPIIEWAKANEISVIASNAPDRYVKIISRNGLEGLKKLPIGSLQYLPPLYTINQFSQKKYEEKFWSFMGGHSHQSVNKNFLLAQYLRDASMTHSILTAFQKNGKKIVHINGRFHSDDFLGVSERLRYNGGKALVVSMFAESRKPAQKAMEPVADIIIITGN